MSVTINGIHYHDSSFDLTVDAVQKVNPYAANYSREGVLASMRRDAERLAAEGALGYCSTLGYVISLYNNGSQIGAVASVSAYSVMKFFEGRDAV